MMQYPASMQPTHARWERVDAPLDAATSGMQAISVGSEAAAAEPAAATIFPPVPPALARSFLVVDTLYENAPFANLGVPGPDGAGVDGVAYDGLEGVGEEVRGLLPEECRAPFERALERERAWKGRWGTEGEDGLRRAPVIDKGMIL